MKITQRIAATSLALHCLLLPVGLSAQTIEGELKQYHKTTLTFEGLQLNEAAETFLNYRMNVTFEGPSSATYIVPAYFAADGDAAETSANSGNKWRCHFTPNEVGTWSYSVSFRQGDNIAVNTNPEYGRALSINGESGTFEIANTDKNGPDFRAKGKFQYVGETFARFDNGDYYFEVGADSPETFLEYADFDATNQRHDYAEMASYYNDGDPGWQGGRGTEIIGAVNYLALQGMNIHYFLTMNITGDGNRTYPFPNRRDYVTYDISKLDQWQIVFDHMYNKGIALEMVLTETENSNWFEFREGIDITNFSNARKLYYREMIARFGYLNVIYNIGEEANWLSGGDVYTAEQIEEAASYIQQLSPYSDLISVHNGPSSDFTLFPELTGLSGTTSINTISLQANYQNAGRGHGQFKVLHHLAHEDGTTWIARYSEPYSSTKPNIDVWTENSLWASITAGSAGIHYYSYNGDVDIDDYTNHEPFYERMSLAKTFFEDNEIPFWNLSNKSDGVSAGYLSTDNDHHYLVFLPDGGSVSIDISGSSQYAVQWFDPRNGGELQQGSLTTVEAGMDVSLGDPPKNSDRSWVVLATKIEDDGMDEPDNSDDTITGIDDQPSLMKVFPNPINASGTMSLTGVAHGTYQITVVDVQGNLVWSESIEINNNIETFDLKQVSPGFYVLQLRNVGHIYQTKLVVDKTLNLSRNQTLIKTP